MVSQVLKVMSRTDSISPAIKLNGSQNCSRLLRHNVVKNYLYEYPNFFHTVLYQQCVDYFKLKSISYLKEKKYSPL